MKIAGIQKMTLLDYPGKVACTVFLAGCNFRCPYCHNGELLSGEIGSVMEQEDLLQLLQNAAPRAHSASIRAFGFYQAVSAVACLPFLNNVLRQ